MANQPVPVNSLQRVLVATFSITQMYDSNIPRLIAEYMRERGLFLRLMSVSTKYLVGAQGTGLRHCMIVRDRAETEGYPVVAEFRHGRFVGLHYRTTLPDHLRNRGENLNCAPLYEGSWDRGRVSVVDQQSIMTSPGLFSESRICTAACADPRKRFLIVTSSRTIPPTTVCEIFDHNTLKLLTTIEVANRKWTMNMCCVQATNQVFGVLIHYRETATITLYHLGTWEHLRTIDVDPGVCCFALLATSILIAKRDMSAALHIYA